MIAMARMRAMTPNNAAPGWTFVHRLVVREAQRLALTREQLAKRARMNRSTLDRMRKGEQLSEDSLARIEGALDMPRDLLRYAAEGDIAAMKRALKDNPDLVRWVSEELAERKRPTA